MIKNKGFTLIEMVLYLALFSIIMSGLVTVFFQLSVSGGNTLSKMRSEAELNFVLKKIEWALSDASKINSPTSGTSGELSINKIGFNKNPIVIRWNETDKIIELCTNTCSPLTTQNIEIKNLSFELIDSGKLKINLSLDGESLAIFKYLKYAN